MKEKIKPFINKIKDILSNKKTIFGVIAFTIVMIFIIIISIIILNKGTVPTLRNSNWDDFEVYIEGNTINLGIKMSELEKMKFISLDNQYYGTSLSPKYITSGILYASQTGKGRYNQIYLSAYNNSNENKQFNDCILYGIEINQKFYKDYQVILPKGLTLNTEITIDTIIKKWGNPTSKENNLYQWENEKGLIKLYINNDKTIFSIIYNMK